MATTTFKIWRGERGKGAFTDYSTDVTEGMVVLDAMHQIQAENANDLAIRWNCKAGKCGSCSAEINGHPKLMCMTRMDELPANEPVTVEPMRAFPHVRDLVTDVSWNFEAKKKIKKFKPRAPDAPDGTWRMDQVDVDRVQEYERSNRAYALSYPGSIHLLHPPRTVGRVGRARCEGFDPLLDLEVPRDVDHQVADQRKRAHRLDGDGLVDGQLFSRVIHMSLG